MTNTVEHGTRIRTSLLDWIALALVIVGALNWGLVGLGQYMSANLNVVDAIFGSMPALEAAIYLLVGLAGLYELYFAYKLYGARTEREDTRPAA